MKKKSKRKETRRLLMANLIFLSFLCLIGWLFYFLWQSYRKAIWDGKYQLNFVIQTDQVMIFSFHPEDKVLNILTIPSQTHILVADERGEYQIGNIYQLGELEKIGGGKLLSSSLREFLALPVDGYIIKPPDSIQPLTEESLNDNLEKGKLLSLYFCLLRKRCQTNFSGRDLANLLLKINQLKSGQIKTVAFDEVGMVKEKTLPDGSTILQSDYFRIDQLSQELFSDKTILNEGITVLVLNGTSQIGLANNMGRLVKNLGAELIGTGNTKRDFKNSVIYYRNKKLKDSYTLKRLAKIWQIEKIEKNDQIEGEINLILGEDFKLFP